MKDHPNFNSAFSIGFVCILIFLCLVFLILEIGQADEALNYRLFENIEALNIEGVKEMLRQGADPNSLWMKYNKPMLAFEVLTNSLLFHQRDFDFSKRTFEIAKILFENGARLGPLDSNVLFFPIARGHVALIGLLIDNGASLSRKLEGYTPAELAL